MVKEKTQYAVPTGGASRRWFPCETANCPGERASGEQDDRFPHCVAHLPADLLSQYLSEVDTTNLAFTLSGLVVTPSFLQKVESQLADSSSKPSIPAACHFDDCMFADGANFGGWQFRKGCTMWNAIFEGYVHFNDGYFGANLELFSARFADLASFTRTIFDGDVSLVGIECIGAMNLSLSQFRRDLDLSFSSFRSLALDEVTVEGDLRCRDMSFDESGRGSSTFAGLQVSGRTDFAGSRFASTTIFNPAERNTGRPTLLGSEASFKGCAFGSPGHIGHHDLGGMTFPSVDFSDCSFFGSLSFSGAKFTQQFRARGWRIDPVVSMSRRLAEVEKMKVDPAKRASARARIPKVTLDLTGLTLPNGALLEDIAVYGSVRINCNEVAVGFDVNRMGAAESVEVFNTVFPYVLLDLQANDLVFSRCQFVEGGKAVVEAAEVAFQACDARKPFVVASGVSSKVKNLDDTNVENFVFSGTDLSDTTFGSASAGLDKMRLEGNIILKTSSGLFRARRRVIDDERLARDIHNAPSFKVQEKRSAFRIAAASYRGLRKGREDSKDEPDAADFYYGEMEMRRMAAPLLSAERLLLTLYWCVSGYALRAWRPIAALAVALGAGGFALSRWGFAPGVCKSTFDSSLFLAQVAVGLPRPPEALTDQGVVLLIACRILCPLLLALAVLAIRGRVKR